MRLSPIWLLRLISGTRALAAIFLWLFSSVLHASEALPDYEISPEDLLEISVWKEPELQRQVVVRPDGGISFPLAGDLKAAGLTPKELQESITAISFHLSPLL